jgi:hypothetical protein
MLLAVVFLIRNRSPFGKNQTSFATEPDREITRIELSQAGKKLVLEHADKEWRINGKYEARNSGISFLLNVLTEIKIKSPVSPDVFSKEITGMNIIPVRVRVFEKNSLIRSFYVFRTRSNIYGNIMKRKPTAKPFIVYIPGIESDIGSVFTADELFWRPFMVFNILPSEISSVSVENFSDPGSSFNIESSAGKFRLSGSDSVLTGWDTLRVRRYLSYFIMVPFESWAPDLGRDTETKIKNSTPLYRINLTKTDGSKVSLTLWEKLLEGSGVRDSDRLWARTGERDELFIIRYFDIDPLLKKKSYFFKE